MGFEPTNVGFANRCLRPLGYPADAWLRAQFSKGELIRQVENVQKDTKKADFLRAGGLFGGKLRLDAVVWRV